MAPRTGGSAPHIDVINGTVRQSIRTTLTASGSTVDSTWVYDRDEPWTVHVSFTSGGVQVRWMFDRELLSHGLERWVGSGDIRIGPAPLRVRGPRATVLHLVAQRTVVPAMLDTHAIEAFLRATTSLVPLGHEHHGVDWDGHLAGLLASD